ncbi:LANO_0B02014g1_1 [Lachancea nothofagi CBS 11611]|uniref:LANO_0B02014g1_1 n=1 Tax=Lachancea nothofagi CBS 11611 TaxID=1266666 RepID=A0A1G4IVJ0_9SACH|nr:LANO_0B02014g1_1 [Lachancea nothofagi CBS 11611]
MGLISRIFRLGKGASKSLPDQCEYAKWNKDQLINKIIELEGMNKRKAEDGDEREGQVSKKQKHSKNEVKKRKKKDRTFDFSKYNTRFVALRFAYLGWNYNGLAIQKEPTPLPTVEGTILEAMNACKLVPSMTPQEYNFSRCGRTDKGVSAMNQVISLRVRSNLTDQEQQDKSNDDKEINYVHILNQILPDDIRVSAVCLRPPKNFDARFSCEYRHYRYLFHSSGLNIERMQEAAQLYLGEHDFRNFCKLDGSKQITNYKRTIKQSCIIKLNEEVFCLDLIGSAFLWHQVRCMMANLFLVGQELEKPSVISEMLNVEKVRQKPIYDMASDVPLILYDCSFPDMEWSHVMPNEFKSLQSNRRIYSLALDYKLKSTISDIFANVLSVSHNDLCGKVRINLGDGKGKVVTVYEEMLKRNVMDSVDTVNQKFQRRKTQKKKNNANTNDTHLQGHPEEI